MKMGRLSLKESENETESGGLTRRMMTYGKPGRTPTLSEATYNEDGLR